MFLVWSISATWSANCFPDTAGQKNVITDIAQVTVGPLLQMLSDGVSALYNNHRSDDALTRPSIVWRTNADPVMAQMVIEIGELDHACNPADTAISESR